MKTVAESSNQQCATAKHEIRPAEDVLWHLREATREAEMLVRGGSIEVAVRNPNVASYMKHWEERAEKAEAEVEQLRAQRDGYRGAVERLNAALDRRKKPERPVAWYRWAGSNERVPAPIFAWGDWPPPEPDDTVWHPLYSTPEGRPADETFDGTSKP